MNEFWKYTLIIMGANLFVFLFCFAFPPLFVLWFVGLLIQLLVGIGLVFSQSTRTIGQSFLLSFAIMFVIGFSVCSRMAFNGSGF